MSEKTKSEIYLRALPMLTSGRVELLDNRRLLAQMRNLERRVGRSGRDSVDHPPRQQDDVANAACGALVQVRLGAAHFVLPVESWSTDMVTGTRRMTGEPVPVSQLSRSDLAQVHPHDRPEREVAPDMSRRKAAAWAEGGPVTFHPEESYAQCQGCGLLAPVSLQSKHLRECERGRERGGFLPPPG